MLGPTQTSKHCETSPLARIDEEGMTSIGRTIISSYVGIYTKAIKTGKMPNDGALKLPDARTPAPHYINQTLAYECAKIIDEGGCPFVSSDAEGHIIPKQTEPQDAPQLSVVKR